VHSEASTWLHSRQIDFDLAQLTHRPEALDCMSAAAL